MRTPDVLQRAVLLAGAAADGAFGAAMLLAPEPAARLLHLELPAQRAWFDVAGLLLLILAGCYVVARRDASWAQATGLVAGLGRTAGAFVLARHAALGAGAALGLAAVLDATLAALHLAAWTWGRSSAP